MKINRTDLLIPAFLKIKGNKNIPINFDKNESARKTDARAYFPFSIK
ncbi:MAG: hypothetical protein IPH11_09805 [Ignavibacteriales bacterium]|nr:hypothetical protein [Ignavibacteriales bacterium]